MGLIDSPDNGATERPDSSNESIIVSLVGPIRYWWKPGVENTRQCKLYMAQRDKIFYELSEDFLIYAPHRALRGPWDARAQLINNAAIARSDALVVMNAGVPMAGTREEQSLAQFFELPSFDLFIGDRYNINDQLLNLKAELHAVRRRD